MGFASDLARGVCRFLFCRRQTMNYILCSVSGLQPDRPFSTSPAFQVHNILLIQEDFLAFLYHD